MSLSDAKTILKSLLEKEINDSLLDVYTVVDSLNKNKITLLVDKIEILQNEKNNLTEIVNNLNSIIDNLKSENEILSDVIKKQKKELRKQKIIKMIAPIGDVALPVATLLVGISIK
jgi:FtsZ-binding cell division protein ZapB